MTTTYQLTSYSEQWLDAIVEFWNRSFSEYHHFFPLTAKTFSERVIAIETSVERFDPHGMCIAYRDNEILGFIHAGIRDQYICQSLDPHWTGEEQGYIAFLFVAPTYRRQGIGHALWNKALEYLKDIDHVMIDGQCLNPFYGNIDGPFTPFWGTPEGVSIRSDDDASVRFFAHHGFEPRYKGDHFTLDVSQKPNRPSSMPSEKVEIVSNMIVKLGDPLRPNLRYPSSYDSSTCVVVKNDVVIAMLIYYRLNEVSPDLFAIYHAEVLPKYHGMGMGTLMMHEVLSDMRDRGGRTCEVMTLPALSPKGFHFYTSMNFKRTQEWLIY